MTRLSLFKSLKICFFSLVLICVGSGTVSATPITYNFTTETLLGGNPYGSGSFTFDQSHGLNLGLSHLTSFFYSDPTAGSLTKNHLTLFMFIGLGSVLDVFAFNAVNSPRSFSVAGVTPLIDGLGTSTGPGFLIPEVKLTLVDFPTTSIIPDLLPGHENTAPIPEPSSLILLGSGTLAAARKLRKKRPAAA